MDTIKEKRCYTIQDLQDILRISRPSVYKLLKSGEFHSFKIAGSHRIPKEGFDAWLNGNTVGPLSAIHSESRQKENNKTAGTSTIQDQQEIVMPAASGFRTANVGPAQEDQRYQKIKESNQNWLKAYLVIDPSGHKE